MKKILLSLIAIGLVGSLISGGVFTYFQDTEVSAGNTFTSGTLDLGLDIDTITVKLHPNSINDATIYQSSGGVPLPPQDRKKLALSDDSRVTTQDNWKANYATTTYLRFRFPDIPSYANVSSTKISMEWQRKSVVTGAKLDVFDGTATETHPIKTPSAANVDSSQTVDISTQVDTAAKVNNIDVRFQAKGKGKTSHNLVELEVTYDISGNNPLLVLQGLKPGEPQGAVITINNAGSLSGTAKLHFKNMSGSNVGTKESAETDDENAAEPFVPEEVALSNIDNPQLWIKTRVFFDGSEIGLSSFESGADKNNFVDLNELNSQCFNLGTLGAGKTKDIEMSFNLDPGSQTGGIYIEDRVTFDIEVRLDQL